MWNLKYGTDLWNRSRFTDTENRLMVAEGGEGEGWTENLGLVNENYYI